MILRYFHWIQNIGIVKKVQRCQGPALLHCTRTRSNCYLEDYIMLSDDLGVPLIAWGVANQAVMDGMAAWTHGAALLQMTQQNHKRAERSPCTLVSLNTVPYKTFGGCLLNHEFSEIRSTQMNLFRSSPKCRRSPGRASVTRRCRRSGSRRGRPRRRSRDTPWTPRSR